jgi:23S rRNA pseudouridine1911/1915/1917 synthase
LVQSDNQERESRLSPLTQDGTTASKVGQNNLLADASVGLMSVPLSQTFAVPAEQTGATLAAFVRAHFPDLSWSRVRRMIETRRVRVGGDLCLDPARRLREGSVVEVTARPAPTPRQQESIKMRYRDTHLVVVEKPAGLNTVRHPSERDWPKRRKELSPTVEDLVPKLIAREEGWPATTLLPRLRIVQRLDKETSGLVVFARTVAAERGLGKQFHAHTVMRRYLAIVPGSVQPQRIASRLVRDRGDGRRGSGRLPGIGKDAITHVDVVERLPGYTLLSCRLETGRTHQIRIHLAELGHPVCGEKVYQRRPDGTMQPNASDAPRLALHAAELGFVHPVTGEQLHWNMPLPDDLQEFLQCLRGQTEGTSAPLGGRPSEVSRPTKKRSKRGTRDGDQVDRH